VRVTVIDYGRGNLFSLGRALDYVGASFALSERSEDVHSAECLILPGVGAFGDAMDGLRQRGLIEPIHEAVERGVPLLGICLGMQLLATRGEEFGDHAGLDVIPGTVSRMPDGDGMAQSIRIPNVGWRRVTNTRATTIGTSPGGATYYFVHSYAYQPSDPQHVLGTIAVNGRSVAAIIGKGDVVGCQFHPEKSGPEGLAFLRSFLGHVASRGKESTLALAARPRSRQ